MTKIKLTSEITKKIEKINYYSNEQFINDAKRYIKAIKEGRMICHIASVSRSGMSRNICFLSCQKHTKENRYSYLNYYCLFLALGYTKSGDNFRIGGCGMDMIFHTNYSIIHDFKRIGLLSDKDCRILAQKTPTSVY